jgi:hypothetical protein
VKVTLWPYTEGLAEEFTVVVVVAGLIEKVARALAGEFFRLPAKEVRTV